ncbi:MAG: phosphoribosylformylglycinamidine synthase subunit PurS [candidate division WOR-3 bacterium]|nr:phosphoribosylformylglycinamidine synthase subunit PurS [candidate division WOR-3 bacterium]MCX7947963.1 phosphoribosylformylglycinamidine synthase subunit PurS [candidate division WOR-3 bacterium]MDW8150907.1 phosphoribosylformylglycinamidine synthase subunit PurS [candidate division WOR-3 bacterium]
MKEYKVKVLVLLKDGLFDPQGKVIEDIIKSKNINVENVRIGKLIVFNIKSNSKEEILETINKQLATLFANPVVEKFEIEIEELNRL